MSNPNLVLMTDSYKVSHWSQLPEGTEHIYSFFESRGGKFPEVVFFGLQALLRKYLCGPVITRENIEEAAIVYSNHFGTSSIFNFDGWERLRNKHMGYLPLLIKAVPEGTVVPTHNVMMTVENTDPEFPWLTNWFETVLSQIWYPCTVSTQSREMRRVILKYLTQTGDPGLIDFKMHDFGFRGSNSIEAAGIGGCAHLVSFNGSDTLAGILVARDYYGETMAGFSIPAAEHSTITSWGRENEAAAYENMLDQFPTGLVAVVSDSYDIFNAVKNIWGGTLKDKVLARDGVLVIRPDSGPPVQTVLQVLDLLSDAFGGTFNEKGYRVLNPKVRVIQGDGIDYEMLKKILSNMEDNGWSADNIAFGSGGGLLQKMDRDTQKFAFKCSAVRVKGEWRDVMKDPVTDPGKRSKAGRLALLETSNGKGYSTVRKEDAGCGDCLETVFKDGYLLRSQSFAEIRARARRF